MSAWCVNGTWLEPTFQRHPLVNLGVLVQDLARHSANLVPILDYVIGGRSSRGNCEADYVFAFERCGDRMKISPMIQSLQKLRRKLNFWVDWRGDWIKCCLTFSVSSFSPLKRNTTMPKRRCKIYWMMMEIWKKFAHEKGVGGKLILVGSVWGWCHNFFYLIIFYVVRCFRGANKRLTTTEALIC